MTKKIKLNACQSHCCPEMLFNDDGSVTLTDDYGGSVRMTRDEVVFAGRFLLEHAPVEADGGTRAN